THHGARSVGHAGIRCEEGNLEVLINVKKLDRRDPCAADTTTCRERFATFDIHARRIVRLEARDEMAYTSDLRVQEARGQRVSARQPSTDLPPGCVARGSGPVRLDTLNDHEWLVW